jgi:glycosyltransferase involved in cell wall biosynthesis
MLSPIDSGTLSVVIPVYNEEDFILTILKKVQEVDLENFKIEIIVVDDCSSDNTRSILRQLQETAGIFEVNHSDESPEQKTTINTDPIKIHFSEENRGKGASLRQGFEQASGDVIIVQDADLEYNPEEYPKLLEPIVEGKADVVYGSRFTGGPQRVLYFWHYAGNNFLTLLSNMLTNINLSDMETCYKMFRREVLDDIELQEDGFGFEPEFTAKVAHQGYRIFEVPISYFGRTYEEGKKIGWVDGLVAIWCIFKYNLWSN